MRVIFRKYTDGQVIAWLPDIPTKRGYCMSYMARGQHCEAIYSSQDSVLAKPAEYNNLLNELLSIYDCTLTIKVSMRS